MERDKQNQRMSLKVVHRPMIGIDLTAPPVLIASSHTVDYVCGKCASSHTVDYVCGKCGLLRAEECQVFGLVIECCGCGACNATDV